MTRNRSPRNGVATSRFQIDPEGVAATRGLLIGLALSQVFWIGLALIVLR